MKPFARWHDAFDWCRKNAAEDCWVLVLDWFDPEDRAQFGGKCTARLKYEHGTQCFFYKGFAQ